MSFNFTVQSVIDFPNGRYRAQIDHMEYVESEFGNYPLVHFKMVSPQDFQGRVLQKRYNIEHNNPTTRHIAIKDFSHFCIEIGGVKVGEDPTEDDFLLKIVDIDIENKKGNDGRNYTNIVKIESADTNRTESHVGSSLNSAAIPGLNTSTQYGSITVPLQDQPISNQPLNDEVPF